MHFALSASYLGTDLAGRYRLERLIGEGATSWVFAARDLRLEREVAVKLLKPRAEPEHSAQRLRFVHEGRILARLAHPHVVAVHDAGDTCEGDGYLVMELSQAGSLEAELFRRSTLSLEETLALLLPLLGALGCAHDRGIIHRDLKPANIALIKHDRGRTSAKLLDFGIARLGDASASSGGLSGTPAYMAPEQARAETLSPATDVWAMGAVLFRCLSGRLPFEATSPAGVLLKLVQERAARIASTCPNLAPRVAVAIDRALEPDPSHRYPDMRTFARVLGLACRQDGVSIDSNPEPIGLPDFAAWLQRADLEATRRSELAYSPPQEASSRIAIQTTALPARARHAAPPRRTRFPGVVLAAASFVVAIAALWMALGRPTRTRGQPALRAPTSAAPQPQLRLVGAAIEASMPSVIPGAAPEEPVREPPAAAPSSVQRRAETTPSHGPRKAQNAATTAASASTAQADSAGEPEQQGLIKSWDW